MGFRSESARPRMTARSLSVEDVTGAGECLRSQGANDAFVERNLPSVEVELDHAQNPARLYRR